jgi:AcrR family transcriptional regulator
VNEQHRSPSGRKLTLHARAERQQQTRRRITEAAVQLHQELGPLRTTVTAIAELARVERLTVYRHFPDEHALHAACQRHFFTLNPPPDPRVWTEIAEFAPRVRAALTDLYAYWDRVQDMAATVLRDHQIDPERAGGGIVAFTNRSRDAILSNHRGRGTSARTRQALVSHAVHYYTWRSLVHDGGLTNRQAVTLMTTLVTTAA